MKKTIILIENDASVADVIKFILTEAGYTLKIIEANNYLDIIIEVNPGLILLDYTLGNHISGHEVCKSLKHNPKTSHIPVILVSAITGLDEIAKECLADGVLAKPFDIIQLEEIAYKWLSSSSQQTA